MGRRIAQKGEDRLVYSVRPVNMWCMPGSRQCKKVSIQHLDDARVLGERDDLVLLTPDDEHRNA